MCGVGDMWRGLWSGEHVEGVWDVWDVWRGSVV